MVLRPTPPAPTTTTLSPSRMFAVFTAAPNPVRTPHPINAAIWKGTSSGIFTQEIAGTTVSSEKVPAADICATAVPSFMEKRDV